jgi:hypothetical protein
VYWTHGEVFALIEAHDDYWEYGHRKEVVALAEVWNVAKSDYTAACDAGEAYLAQAAEAKERLLAETARFRQAVRERVVGPEIDAMMAEEVTPYQRALVVQQARKARRRGLRVVKPGERS